jgi:hypothetical protein
MFPRLVVVSIIAAACSTSSVQAPDAAEPSDPASLVCYSGNTTFPELEKACAVASDCFVALHTVSCCGTQIAIGLDRTSETAFASAEMTCAGAFPGCECLQLPTMAEDGHTSAQGTIEVRCNSGRCETYVRVP